MKILLSFLYSLITCIYSTFSSATINPSINAITVNTQENAKDTAKNIHYDFASIELLIEQAVGRIVLTQIYKNIGFNINVSALPGKRAQYVANSGIKDGEIMRIWTYGNESPNTIRVPTPYYYLETMPFVLEDSKIVITKKEDLANYRLTTIRGVKHTTNITKGLKNTYEMSSTKDMFTLLVNGKVDVALTNTIDGNLALAKLGLNHIVSMKDPLVRLPLYHYIHKDHKDVIPLIDKEIKRMKNNGELTALILSAEAHMIKLNQ